LPPRLAGAEGNICPREASFALRLGRQSAIVGQSVPCHAFGSELGKASFFLAIGVRIIFGSRISMQARMAFAALLQ